jgi:hypothetical protein
MSDVTTTATSERGFFDEGQYPGIFAWLLSTDHKRIGLLYFWCIIAFFCVGAILGLLIRLELFAPGETIMGAQTYNAVFTLHGVIMIFLFIIPGIPAAFGNLIMPIQIGARDVAFPKLNLFSWYLYITGAILAVTSLFTGGGPPDTGWTFYVPFSAQTSTNVSLAAVAVFILGFSSILTGLNFVTTVHRLRTEGMTWMRIPLFTWSLYATAWIQILATPVIGITVALLFAERVIGTGLFDPAQGGDPIMFQHLFWIYSHPAVYIMILPGMGVVSDIIPVFSRKPCFGYKAIVVSSLAIAFKPRHRLCRFPGLGTPHVHQRHVGHGGLGLLVFDLHRCHSLGNQGLQLAGNPLRGFHPARSTASLRAVIHPALYHRRANRPGPRRGGGRCPRSRYLLRRWPLPFRHVRRYRYGLFCRHALLAAKDLRPHVRQNHRYSCLGYHGHRLPDSLHLDESCRHARDATPLLRLCP